MKNLYLILIPLLFFHCKVDEKVIPALPTENLTWNDLNDYLISNSDGITTFTPSAKVDSLMGKNVSILGYCRAVDSKSTTWAFTKNNYSEWELSVVWITFEISNSKKPNLESQYLITGILKLDHAYKDGSIVYKINDSQLTEISD